MHNAIRQRGPRSFSLVELVIVVVIIGIISAIAVTRLVSASENAAEAALLADLGSMRRAIDMYAAEHDGRFPATTADGDGNPAKSAGAFRNQLVKFSTEKGSVSDSRDSKYRFGPYLHAIPPASVGPNRGSTAVAIDTTNSPPLVTAGTEGWVYNPATGEIIVNTDDPNASGKLSYDQY